MVTQQITSPVQRLLRLLGVFDGTIQNGPTFPPPLLSRLTPDVYPKHADKLATSSAPVPKHTRQSTKSEPMRKLLRSLAKLLGQRIVAT
ncbi:hypothetical protein ACTXT7_015276, partial [Hymenolepis weldensis]